METLSVLEHEGAFSVQTDHNFDVDRDHFASIVCWPWEGHIKENGTILFAENRRGGRRAIRQVILHEGGKFVLKTPFRGDQVLHERDVTVLGVVKFTGRFV